jgi:hypothetical protein
MAKRLIVAVLDGLVLAPVVRGFIASWTRRNYAKDRKANVH